ncbi:MAG: hypothetical protein GXP48_10350 [Acidobacteria bacterium]|nr:hypothetical protein [Acidobacteriota bacterium]
MKYRSLRSALVVTGVMVLSGVPLFAQTQVHGYVGPPASTCPQVIVTAVDTPAQLSRNRFSATRTTDLVFHVLFQGKLDKNHVVTLKVYTPRGHLYQTLNVPVAPQKGHTPMGSRRLAGYPYPVRIKAPQALKYNNVLYDSINVRLPVAGSSIVTSSLYGRWKVEIQMDGMRKPCPDPTYFFIVQ